MSLPEWQPPEVPLPPFDPYECRKYIYLLINDPFVGNPHDLERAQLLCKFLNHKEIHLDSHAYNITFVQCTEDDLKVADASFWLVFKRIVDKGHANLVSREVQPLQNLRASRLAARAACLALLSVAKRRGDLRGIIARELWRDMAERVWEKRWEFK